MYILLPYCLCFTAIYYYTSYTNCIQCTSIPSYGEKVLLLSVMATTPWISSSQNRLIKITSFCTYHVTQITEFVKALRRWIHEIDPFDPCPNYISYAPIHYIQLHLHLEALLYACMGQPLSLDGSPPSCTIIDILPIKGTVRLKRLNS